MTLDQIALFFKSKNKFDPNLPGLYTNLLDMADSSTESNKLLYRVSLSARTENVNYSKGQLERFAVEALLGTGDRERDDDARSAIKMIVGEKVLNRAINDINTSFKEVRDLARQAMKSGLYDTACDFLSEASSPAILDVLSTRSYEVMEISAGRGGAARIEALETKNPLEYDGNREHVCIYLPQAYDGYSHSVVTLMKDERVVMVSYRINGSPIGSAPCYFDDNTFLVNSVEGNLSFRREAILDTVFSDLVKRAEMRSARRIVFNDDAYNSTPNFFLDMVRDRQIRYGSVKVNVDMSTGLSVSDNFLESANPVKGYIIDLKRTTSPRAHAVKH